MGGPSIKLSEGVVERLRFIRDALTREDDLGEKATYNDAVRELLHLTGWGSPGRVTVPREEALADAFLHEVIGSRVDILHSADTPRRFAKMIRELTTPEEFEFTTFDNDPPSDEMVIVKDISFTALCAHHVLPFTGVCHIAYVPAGHIAGLSKFARAVRFWTKGLWVQERLTNDLCNYLLDMLDPKGVGVIMEAEHTCMTIRGIQAAGTKTITSAMRGVFLNPDKEARNEFLSLINRRT